MFNSRNLSKFFSEVINKRLKMEITIRTPYKTYLKENNAFDKILTKTNEGTLCIQNRTPASIHVLPPGFLKVKLTENMPEFNGELYHTGGWCVVHPDNTCDIDLIDAFPKEELSLEELQNSELDENEDTMANKYAKKIRKQTKDLFLKKLI